MKLKLNYNITTEKKIEEIEIFTLEIGLAEPIFKTT